MIALSPETSAVIALRAAEQSWIIFLQSELPGGLGSGRIKIIGLRGAQLAKHLATTSRECPYTIYLIGMIPTTLEPRDHADAIVTEHIHHHDGWYEATPDLIAFIAAVAQEPLHELLGEAQPGASEEPLVDIEDIAQMLNCSVVTVRRMVDRKQIPFYRLGRAYRFSPSSVLASLQQR